LFLEHALTAFATAKLGAAIAAPPDDGGRIVAALHALLASRQFSMAAEAFASQHAAFEPQALVERVVNRAESLAER
jgi:hypothetical protein